MPRNLMKDSNHARMAGWLCAVLFGLNWVGITAGRAAEPPSLRVLFLGDNGHHRPADRFRQLQPALASRGIELIYTDQVEDLNPARLAGFDCLAIYANTTRLPPAQERAL